MEKYHLKTAGYHCVRRENSALHKKYALEWTRRSGSAQPTGVSQAGLARRTLRTAVAGDGAARETTGPEV